MKTIEIFNFHDLIVDDKKQIKIPLIQPKELNEKVFSIIIIRNPYTYFNYLLSAYIDNKKSILFTDDMIYNMKKLNNQEFIIWFQKLNFIPFYNPQTFQLDTSKRINLALDNLERFDYVIPYEDIDIFLENFSSKINIVQNKNKKNIFLLSEIKDSEIVSKFIDKDMKLYNRAKELWKIIKENKFKPLREIIEQKPIYTQIDETEIFKGASGMVTEKSIRGYALNIKTEKILTLNIYNNNKLICTIIADIVREDMINKFNLNTGKCGFFVEFEKPTFKKGDSIDIIIVPDNIRLPIVADAKNFLEL